MPVPNEDQASYKDQAELDTGDFAIIENVHQGYCVLSGGAVTAQGTPDGTVAVASGTAKVASASVTITAGNVSVISGSANPDGSIAQVASQVLARFSLITINSAGQLGVLHGDEDSLSPNNDGSYVCVFPDFSGVTVLASIFIPPTFTTVAPGQIGDKRIIKTDGDFVARILTPTALSTAVNDYAPTGLSTANVLRLTTNSSNQRNVSGLNPTGHKDGKILRIDSLGPGPVVLLSESTDSIAANRFATAGEVRLTAGRCVVIAYDLSSSRWRVIGGTSPATANTIALGSAAAAGIEPYYLRSDDTIAAFDTTVPSTQVSGDAAATGSAAFAARRDHKHAIPNLITQAVFAKSSTVAVATGALRWYNDTGRTLAFVATRATVGTQPTGASLIVDVNVDGTTIFTTQASRPTIAASTNTDQGETSDVTTIANGSYLTVDVDQVGSNTPGSDLTVQITMKG
jgi:hypothetical protein